MTAPPVIRSVQKIIYALWPPQTYVCDTQPDGNPLIAYCTEHDMIYRFGEEELIHVSNEDNLCNLSGDKLYKAIAEASIEMDTHLTKYLPQITGHPSLIRIACNIARYHLYGDAVTEHIKKHYIHSINFLKHISKGDISLGPMSMSV